MGNKGRLASIVGLLLMLALVAAACSSDSSSDDEVSAGDSSESTEDTPTEEATEDATEEATEDATEEATEAPIEAEVPEELPASFQGVSPTSIKVGVVVPDFDALTARGINNYHGSAETTFQPFIDDINASGGIFGRQIEPVYVGFDFLAPETQQEACVRLAEDEEVFIVLYGFLSDNNVCLTDVHNVMVMTEGFQTAELREASGDTLWINLNAADDAASAIMGIVLAQEGYLDGKTIGILTSREGTPGRSLEAALSELGIGSTLILLESDGTDQAAIDAEMAIVAERFRTEGVDFVFDLIGGGWSHDGLINQGFVAETAFISLDAALNGVTDAATLDGALTVAQPSLVTTWLEDAEFEEICKDPILAANPDLADQFATVPADGEESPDNPNWSFPTFVACNQMRLFKALGEIAGADLTNDSFKAALDDLGEFDLVGFGQASFRSEDKWDGLDEFTIQEYNAEAAAIEIIGEPIIVVR